MPHLVYTHSVYIYIYPIYIYILYIYISYIPHPIICETQTPPTHGTAECSAPRRFTRRLRQSSCRSTSEVFAVMTLGGPGMGGKAGEKRGKNGKNVEKMGKTWEKLEKCGKNGKNVGFFWKKHGENGRDF